MEQIKAQALNGSDGTKFISIRKAQQKLRQYVRSMTAVKNGALQHLAPQKKGKDLILSGGDKSHKISEQLLSFGMFRIRSRCRNYDVNLTPKVCLALKKCGHTSQLSQPTV